MRGFTYRTKSWATLATILLVLMTFSPAFAAVNSDYDGSNNKAYYSSGNKVGYSPAVLGNYNV